MILGIRHEVLAYQFDDAVLTFGLYIDGKLKEKSKDGKRYLHSLESLLLEKHERPKTDNAQAFQKLAGMAGVKVVE